MSVTVTVAGFGGTQTVEIENGSSIEVAAQAANVPSEAVIRVNGQKVDSPADTPVEDGATYVATPPQGKQGL